MDALAREIERLDEEEKANILAYMLGFSAAVSSLLQDNVRQTQIRSVDNQGNTRVETRSTVLQSRLRRIMREIDRLETQYQRGLYSRLIDAMERSSIVTVRALMERYDFSRPSPVDVDRTLGKTVRIGDKTLEQRTQVLTSDITSDIRRRVRSGALGGEDVDDIVRDVRRTFQDSDWKVNRIVESEIYQTYRYQFGETSSENGYDWIRIHESFPRHPNRMRHRCYPLANTDKYGRGRGVYRSTDVEIFYPHPQCTSWLEVVEVDISA